MEHNQLRRFSPFICLVLVSIGCSDTNTADAGKTITCAWFAGDNCYKRAVAEANACVDESETGALSADALSCNFTDGTHIGFTTPPTVDMSAEYAWDFEIAKAGGVPCARYTDRGADGGDGFTLQTASGEFKEESVGTLMVLTCPNGERLSIDGFQALACIDSGLPGKAWSTSASSASFSLLQGNDAEELFSCRKEQ